MEVEDEVLERGRTQTCCHWWVVANGPGQCQRRPPPPLAVPVCTPAISPESGGGSDDKQWQALVLPDPGGRWEVGSQQEGKAPTPRQGQYQLVWKGKGNGSSRWNSPC